MLGEKLFKWFKDNRMKDNTYKGHLILLILCAGDSNQSKLKIHSLKAAPAKLFF